VAVMSSRWREAEKRAERAVVAQQEVREHTQREHTHNFNTQFRCGCGASIADVVAEQGAAIAALQAAVREGERRHFALQLLLVEQAGTAKVAQALRVAAAELTPQEEGW